MEHQADVIIVGTGVAGLFCALQLPEELHILMITKDKAEHSDSYLAQGGISTLRTPEDYDSYFEDTMRAGHYKNNPDSVDVMIRSSPQIIQNLIDLVWNLNVHQMDCPIPGKAPIPHSVFYIIKILQVTRLPVN